MFNLRAFGPRLVIPATFYDCLTYGQQVLWLLQHKSPILVAGDNITLTENTDGTITVSSDAGQGGLYRAGGSLIGASNLDSEYPELNQIDMTISIFTGTPTSSTIITVPSDQCDGVCSIAWDERTEQPYRSVMFNATSDVTLYPIEAHANLTEAVTNVWQVGISFEFDGILDIPSNTNNATMLIAVNIGSGENITYNPITFRQDTANSKTYVSTFVVLPSGSTVSSINIKGLTIFS